MVRSPLKRIVCLLSGLLALTVTGMGAVTPTHPSSTEVYAPRIGFSRLMGAQTVRGVFKSAGGRCAISLILMGGFATTSPRRINVLLAPDERAELTNGATGTLALTCGRGGRSLIVASSR